MNAADRAALWARLRAAGVVDGESPPARDVEPPWYVRAMIGGAAWIAAVFVIAAVLAAVTSLFRSGASMAVIGLVLSAAGVALLRAGRRNTFVGQLGLAVGLAGQGLFAAGVLSGGFALAGGPGPKFEASQFALIAAFEAALVAAAPVVVHRCLCVLGAAVALGGAAVVLEATALYVPLVALLFALAALLCVADGARAELWQACAVGLALALLASIAVLVAEPNFIALGRRVPRPSVPEWIGAAAMATVFAAVVAQLLRATEVSPTSRTGAAIWALAAALIVATWPVPGLLAAVVALVVAFAIGHEVLTGLGVAVLLAALARYYFGLEAPLLVKSAALFGTGVVLLAGWYALRLVAPERTEAARA